MRCGICHFVAPVDGTSHTARTCPLRRKLCRRSLPRDHPFSEKGQCGNANCVHHKTCGVCGLTGHQYGTQTYAFDRWKLTDGRLLRKNSNRALDETDVVCALMTGATVRNLVNNTQSVSAAAAQVGIERRRNVSRLRANTRAEGVGLDESVRLMQSLGSPATLLQGDNKVAFDALVAARDKGAVAANRRAADAVESDVDGDDGHGAPKDDELDCDVDEDADEDGGVNAAAFGSRGKRIKSLRGPPSGGMGLFAAAINKGKAPRGKGKGKALKDTNTEVKPLLPVAVDFESLWLPGTHQPWSACMPDFYDSDFGSLPPLNVAHLVIEQMCQCPVADADPELASLLTAGSIQSHLRGYTLMSGTLSAAQVADWLCSTMPASMKPALLTAIAVSVDTLVRRRAGLLEESSRGIGSGGPYNAASAGPKAPSPPLARRGLPAGSALSASQSAAVVVAPPDMPVVSAVPVLDVDGMLVGDSNSPAGVEFVRGFNTTLARSGRTGGPAGIADEAGRRGRGGEVEEVNGVDREALEGASDEASGMLSGGAAN